MLRGGRSHGFADRRGAQAVRPLTILPPAARGSFLRASRGPVGRNNCGRGLCPGQGLGRHRPRTYNYSVDKERRRAYTRAYYEENRDKELERARRYRQENPDVIRQASLRRRIKKLGVGDSHTVAQWHALCAEYDHRCLGCGGTDKPLTRDHIIPLSLGGTDYIDNLQPLCLSL